MHAMSRAVWGDAQFNSPQGLAWHNRELYVADTENHAIRKVRRREATYRNILFPSLLCDVLCHKEGEELVSNPGHLLEPEGQS